jgi:hypothetical protein
MDAKVPPRWPASGEEIKELRQTLVDAHLEAGQRRSPKQFYGVMAIAAAIALGFLADRRGSAASKPTVPFGRDTVISEKTAGIGADPDAFEVRAVSAPSATAIPTAEPTKEPKRRASASRPMSALDEGASLEPSEVLVSQAEVDAALAAAPPAPSPEKLTLNIGTRFPVRLVTTATTGAAAGVCSAETVADVVVGDNVALPKGTRLEGLAFATRENDRAQIVFRALVLDGKTVSLQGIVIGKDGEFGVKGKVVRKASKLKHVAGRVTGAVADAAMWGSIGAGTLAGGDYGILDQLTSGAARDLNVLEQQWTRSDKAVRVAAGTAAEVYLRGDVVVVR